MTSTSSAISATAARAAVANGSTRHESVERAAKLAIDPRRVLLIDAPLFFLLFQNARLLRAKVLHLLALSGIGGHFAARVILHRSISFTRARGLALARAPEERRAWHAGVSSHQGREKCNDFSIGVELEGLEGESFEPAQEVGG